MDRRAALLLIWAGCLAGAEAADSAKQTLRYVRWSGEKFVAESTIELQRPERRTVVKSITTRPGTTLTLSVTFDETDQLVEATVATEQNTQRRSARVSVTDQTAQITRADGSRSQLECPRGVIVTSAPDWTDAVSMVRRYDRSQADKQEFPGLWIHPTQEPSNVRFAITRLGSDTVERDGQPHHLDRFLIQLRGGSRYIAWGDERGRLIRLHPEGRPAQGIWLEGWERAGGSGWTSPAHRPGPPELRPSEDSG